MNIWRMKLRSGSGGPDMWPQCHARRIAAITYPSVHDTDLSKLRVEQVPSTIKTSARVSLKRFAWQVVGGDMVLIGDSKEQCVIARGFVNAALGERAYRFNRNDPIRVPGHSDIWRHEVPVLWDKDFTPFPYHDGAPRITVMRYSSEWARSAAGLDVSHSAMDDDFLDQSSYLRHTAASDKTIKRLHAELSNRFKRWLKATYKVAAHQEKNQVDVRFEHRGAKCLAELKICYGENTRAAIREALGQLLEYNHYPQRESCDAWLIVLDTAPMESDFRYICELRRRYALPLSLLWKAGKVFSAVPEPFGERKGTSSAGINRHIVGDGRALVRR